MHYYTFLVHFYCGYRNPVTKIKLCFSSIRSLNTVARTNTVLIHNKVSNRERKEKCSPESHKYGISSGEKLLSTRMSQEWTWVNLEVPGADISWRDVSEDVPQPTLCVLRIFFFLLFPTSEPAYVQWCKDHAPSIPSALTTKPGSFALLQKHKDILGWKWTWQRGKWWLTKLSWQM